MFKRRQSAQEKALLQRIEALQQAIAENEAAQLEFRLAAERIARLPKLVGITNDGRLLTLTFAKDSQLVQLEAMALLSSDIAGLKRMLLEDTPT